MQFRNLHTTVTLTHNNGTQIKASAYVFERGGSDLWFYTNNRWITPYEFKLRYNVSFGEMLNLLFKISYAEALTELLADSNKLLKTIPREKFSGQLYHIPIILGEEHGVKFK